VLQVTTGSRRPRRTGARTWPRAEEETKTTSSSRSGTTTALIRTAKPRSLSLLSTIRSATETGPSPTTSRACGASVRACDASVANAQRPARM